MSSPPNIPDSSVPGMLARSQPPEAWIYDRDPANGIARATFNGEVYAQTINSPAAGVSAFNGRTGSVTLDLADVEAAGGAPLNAPTFTGLVSVPTAAPGTSTTEAASTAYVMQAVQAGAGVATFNGRSGAVVLTASDVTSAGGLANPSPALTGSPTSTTPPLSDSSGAIATTAFVANWGAQNTVLSFNGRRGAVTLALTDVTSVGGAPINSPTFTGVPIVPTANPGTATGQAASCAFVTDAITSGVAGVASFNGRGGAVTLTLADVENAGGAPSLSPQLTGVPVAPTASAGTNSNQLATCAFVETAISDMAPVVTSWNGRTGAVTLQLSDVTAVGGAPLAGPTFSGSVSAPTPTAGDNSTLVATTAFVHNAVSGFMPISGGTFTGSVVLPAGSTIAGYAPLAGATFTGPVVLPAGSTVAGYLPLSGGTLSGGLSGTSVSMSGAVNGGSPSVLGGVTHSGNNLSAPGYIQGMGAVWCAGTTFGLYPQSGSNIIGMASGWYWAYNTGAGDMQWATPAGAAWFMRGSDHFVYNNVNNVGGQGAYVNLCDERGKENIEPATVGLNEVRQLEPISFERIGRIEARPRLCRIDDSDVEIGFSAQQVAEVIPHAVSKAGIMLPDGSGGIDTDKPSLAISLDPIVAALVNAVKTLAARIEELEARGV